MSEHKPKYLWVFGVLTMVLISGLYFGLSWVSNQPPFSDDYNAVQTTSVVAGCSHSVWTSQTNIYLNNGLKLHYVGDVDFLIGRNYTITYRQDTLKILSFKILDGD